MVNILNKCILSILVYNLFFLYRNISFLHEIEIKKFKNYGRLSELLSIK